MTNLDATFKPILHEHDQQVCRDLLVRLAAKYRNAAEGEPVESRVGLLTAAALLEAELTVMANDAG